MAAGLGSAGLAVGLLAGIRKQATSWAVLVLLANFYTGTWLSSPHHSMAGDAIMLVLAAVPSGVGTVVGFAAGQYLATPRPSTPPL
ncbi:hypothetical protein AMK25_20670 [Micromonospora sp. TSRI0369]|nr:hypothetical protein AMK25_20670 [Micromonospora sp. TSRI0369]